MEHKCIPQGSCDECVIQRRTYERDRAIEILACRDAEISRLTRERDSALARLAAAEKVVEAANAVRLGIAGGEYDPSKSERRSIIIEYGIVSRLIAALAAYDAAEK